MAGTQPARTHPLSLLSVGSLRALPDGLLLRRHLRSPMYDVLRLHSAAVQVAVLLLQFELGKRRSVLQQLLAFDGHSAVLRHHLHPGNIPETHYEARGVQVET